MLVWSHAGLSMRIMGPVKASAAVPRQASVLPCPRRNCVQIPDEVKAKLALDAAVRAKAQAARP